MSQSTSQTTAPASLEANLLQSSPSPAEFLARRLVWIPSHHVDQSGNQDPPALYLAPENFPDTPAEQARFLGAVWGAWTAHQIHLAEDERDDREWDNQDWDPRRRADDTDEIAWQVAEDDQQEDEYLHLAEQDEPERDEVSAWRQAEWLLALDEAGFTRIHATMVAADPLGGAMPGDRPEDQALQAGLREEEADEARPDGASWAPVHHPERLARVLAFDAAQRAAGQSGRPWSEALTRGLAQDVPRGWVTEGPEGWTLHTSAARLSLYALLRALVGADEYSWLGWTAAGRVEGGEPGGRVRSAGQYEAQQAQEVHSAQIDPWPEDIGAAPLSQDWPEGAWITVSPEVAPELHLRRPAYLRWLSSEEATTTLPAQRTGRSRGRT